MTPIDLIIEDVYLIGIHPYSYKFGIPGKVIGVLFLTSPNFQKRKCYHVKWNDQKEDYIPFASVEDGSFIFTNFHEIQSGKFKL